jgi:hypothetical protein
MDHIKDRNCRGNQNAKGHHRRGSVNIAIEFQLNDERLYFTSKRLIKLAERSGGY